MLVEADEHRVGSAAAPRTARAGDRRRGRGTGTRRDRGPGRDRPCTHRHADRPSDRRATSHPHPTRRAPRRPSYACTHRVVERAVLQHRPQVQRRAVGDVDERGVAGELGDGVCFGVPAVHDLERDDLGARAPRTTRSRARRPVPDARTPRRPAARGPRRRPRARAAPGRGRGTAPATRRRRAARASRSSSWGRPRRRILRADGAAAFGHRSPAVASRDARAFDALAARLPVGNLPRPHRRSRRRGGRWRSSGSASWVRGSWARASPRSRPRAASKSCCAAARSRPPTRWSPGSRSRWRSRSTGASSKPADRDAALGRVRAVADLGELADCDLVIESVVEDLATKKHLFTDLDRICSRAHDPRHEHLDAARRRDGDGHRPPRQGLRRPLLQPGADDGARRDRARDHVVGRHDRRGDGVRDRRAARTRCRSRTRPASS